MSSPRTCRDFHQWMVVICSAKLPGTMGECVGNHGNCTGGNTIHTPDLDDLASRPCWKLKHTHDATSDTRELSMVLELVPEIGCGGLEYVGRFPGDGISARLPTGNGDMV